MYNIEDIEFSGFLERAFPEETTMKQRYGAKSVTLQVTDACNLRCTYCYQINKNTNYLKVEDGKKFIDYVLFSDNEYCNSNQSAGMVLEFIGGEPFLAIDQIYELTEYAFKQMIAHNHPWLYRTKISICTNGVLYFSPKVQEYIRRYNQLLSLSISIDGNKRLHDKCRIFPDGTGSYDLAMTAVNHYKETYGKEPGTKMTLCPANINDTYDAVISLIETGYTNINFNCVFEEGWTTDHAKIYYQQLKQIGDYCLNNRHALEVCRLSRFNKTNYQPLDPSYDGNYCGGLGSMISINHTGKMYPCIRYMSSSLGTSVPEVVIGDLETGILQKDKYSEIFNIMKSCTRRSQCNDECFYCPIGQGCGWCSAYNYQYYGEFSKRTTFTCMMHKAEALANAYYWNKFYLQENIPEIFLVHIPTEWALEIIDQEEWDQIRHNEELCRSKIAEHNSI